MPFNHIRNCMKAINFVNKHFTWVDAFFTAFTVQCWIWLVTTSDSINICLWNKLETDDVCFLINQFYKSYQSIRRKDKTSKKSPADLEIISMLEWLVNWYEWANLIDSKINSAIFLTIKLFEIMNQWKSVVSSLDTQWLIRQRRINCNTATDSTWKCCLFFSFLIKTHRPDC